MRLVHGFDGEPFAVLKDGLRDLIPIIAQDYGDAAAALAVDYYEMAREAAEIPGFVSLDAAEINAAEVDAAVRWSLTQSTGESPSLEMTGRVLAGSISRKVLDIDADTLVRASVRDKRSVGWKRYLEPDACPFCQMLSDRGAVYTGATARFASHDHCQCSAAPVFDTEGTYRPVSTLPYRASQRRLSDSQRAATNAAVRDYLAANY